MHTCNALYSAHLSTGYWIRGVVHIVSILEHRRKDINIEMSPYDAGSCAVSASVHSLLAVRIIRVLSVRLRVFLLV